MPKQWYRSLSSDEEAIKQTMETKGMNYSNACYGYYNSYWKKSGNFYEAHSMPPNFGQAFVEQWNQTFDNIKIRLVQTRPLFQVIDRYGDPGDWVTPTEGDNIKKDLEREYCLFTYEFNPAYELTPRYHLTLYIAELIRLYCPEFTFWRERDPIPADLIESAVRMNNSNLSSYGVPCKREISVALIRHFDDIELMNDFFEEGKTYKIDTGGNYSICRGGLPTATYTLQNLAKKVKEIEKTPYNPGRGK